MTEKYILVLDEGTTSTRAIVYTLGGRVVTSRQRPLTQHYPAPGWVEHDPLEIWATTLNCARDVIAAAGGADRIAAIGITNQRETIVAWDRRSGQPVCRAIVWQDRRTADQCAQLRDAGHETEVQRRTGLLLDPYFSATKMRWVLDNVPAARALGRDLAFGTIDSWLVWNLTADPDRSGVSRGGGSGAGNSGLAGPAHITDVSNASRTMLLGLTGDDWDAGLAELFDVPLATLPVVGDTHGLLAMTHPDVFGVAIPITAMIGDQQSATIGQGCLTPGQTKATFGTGAFILTNAGTAPPTSRHRLLSTVLCQAGGVRQYALEGSVFVAGSLMQWLRDQLGMLTTAQESEALARSVADSGGVVVVPALSGLGAPHWRSDATGSICGLRLGTTRAHIVRAALEAMAHQCHDLATAFAADGAAWQMLRIDGGMSANDWMAQDIADIVGVPVERPADVETTALGAAMLAAVGAGLYADIGAASVMRPVMQCFTPAMGTPDRQARLAAWDTALARALAGGNGERAG